MWKTSIKIILLPAVLSMLLSCAGAPDKETVAAKDGKPQAVQVSKETNAVYQRALWAVKSGRDEEALKLFTRLTKQHPELSGGFTNLGLLYLKAKKYPQAEHALKQAVTLNPQSEVGFNHLGVIYRHDGRFDEAKKAYLEALKINSKYALAHLNLGILYDIYLQDLPQALSHYRSYKTLNGQDDKLVDKWIVDLERRINAQKKKSQKEG